MPIDPKFKQLLQDIGIDDRLGYHLAALFTRSPVPAYEQELNFGPGLNPRRASITGIDELKSFSTSQGYWNSEERKRESDSDFEDLLVREAVTTGWWTKIPAIDGHSHFENLQSTNWNSLRFKPPPTLDTTDIGWRVEFRPMDIQLTDFENAALTVFVGMIVNIINEFALDFIIPISKVDQGMLRCQEKDALIEQKFWFRVDLFDDLTDYKSSKLVQNDFLKSRESKTNEKVFKELYIWQILEGDATVHPTFTKGLVKLFQEYMTLKKWPEDRISETNIYLNFLSKRARGQIPSGAKFIRDFVLSHPLYKHDSILTPEIAYDLVQMIDSLESGDERSSSNRCKLLGSQF